MITALVYRYIPFFQGGLYLSSSTATITNCVISGNTAVLINRIRCFLKKYKLDPNLFVFEHLTEVATRVLFTYLVELNSAWSFLTRLAYRNFEQTPSDRQENVDKIKLSSYSERPSGPRTTLDERLTTTSPNDRRLTFGWFSVTMFGPILRLRRGRCVDFFPTLRA